MANWLWTALKTTKLPRKYVTDSPLKDLAVQCLNDKDPFAPRAMGTISSGDCLSLWNVVNFRILIGAFKCPLKHDLSPGAIEKKISQDHYCTIIAITHFSLFARWFERTFFGPMKRPQIWYGLRWKILGYLRSQKSLVRFRGACSFVNFRSAELRWHCWFNGNCWSMTLVPRILCWSWFDLVQLDQLLGYFEEINVNKILYIKISLIPTWIISDTFME